MKSLGFGVLGVWNLGFGLSGLRACLGRLRAFGKELGPSELSGWGLR